MRQETVPPTLSESPERRRTHFGNVLDKAEEIMQTTANYLHRYVAYGEDFRADNVA